MKRMKRVLVCTMLLTMLGCLNAVAQTLVVRFTDGTTTDMELTSDFDASIADGKVTFSSGGTTQEYQCASIVGFSYRETKGDVNRDNAVDVADIATIISIMAGGVDMGEAPEGTEAVDLGLPSGTLWANMNLGATSPQNDGLYFAWGETIGYTSNTDDGRRFDWASYKWMAPWQSEWKYIDKYQVPDGETVGCWYKENNSTSDYDFVGDGLSELLLEDDAAAANWKGDWRMPTYQDFCELIEYTDGEWITFAGVNGCKFTNKNDNTKFIFFPAAGCRSNGMLYEQSIVGYYWSATVSPSNTSYARNLFFITGSIYLYYHNTRDHGFPVRAVLRKK